MYIPTIYKNENTTEILDFISANSFGILINQTNGKLWGTHIPMDIAKDENGKDILLTHISKANPQANSLKNGDEVLAIFNGPQHYISSSWYEKEEVPTWDYIAVHIYGTIKIVEGKALYQLLKHQVDKYELHSKQPIKMETLSAQTMKQINGIVGFEIQITDMQAAYKLSQNRNEKDKETIVNELNEINTKNAKAIAKAIEEKKIN